MKLDIEDWNVYNLYYNDSEIHKSKITNNYSY